MEAKWVKYPEHHEVKMVYLLAVTDWLEGEKKHTSGREGYSDGALTLRDMIMHSFFYSQ